MLLENEGLEPQKASSLQQAAFYERTSNPVKAREKLSNLFSAIENHQGLLGRLFSRTLSKRLNWFRRQSRAEWEQSLGEPTFDGKTFYARPFTCMKSMSPQRLPEWGSTLTIPTVVKTRLTSKKMFTTNSLTGYATASSMIYVTVTVRAKETAKPTKRAQQTERVKA